MHVQEGRHHLGAYLDSSYSLVSWVAASTPAQEGGVHRCTFKSSREWKRHWEENSDPKELINAVTSDQHNYTLVHVTCTYADSECKITAGHWPISDHFSKMANQNCSMVHSLCTHGQSNSWRIGKWPTISNFLFGTLRYIALVR